MDYIYGLLGIATVEVESVVKTVVPSTISEPVVSVPVLSVSEPVVSEPVVSEPVVSEPVVSEPVEAGLEKPLLKREEPSKEQFSMVLTRMFDVHVNRSKMFQELKTRFQLPQELEVKEAKEEEEPKWVETEIEVLPVEEPNLNQNPFSEFMKDTMISLPLPPLPPWPPLPPVPIRSKDTFTILGRNVLLLKQIKDENEQVLKLQKEMKEKDSMIQSLTKAVKHKEMLLIQAKKKMEGVALHAQTVRHALERTVMEQSVKAKEMQIQIRQLEKKHRTKCRDLKIKHPDSF
jgi:hypothetical protein